MSRPPARPLQRTPRTPLLAPPAASPPPAAPPATEQAPQPSEAAHPAQPEASAGPSGPAEERFLSTRVPKALHRRVRQASVDLDMPIREIIISAVSEWLDRRQAP